LSPPEESYLSLAAPRSSPTAAPAISVVVNTCNRREELRTLLGALNRQTFDRFEVLAVVGPSTDGTLDMLADEYPGRVRAIPCSEFNLSVSRNLGLRESAGDVVAFIDDDSVPSTTWLEQLAAAYEDDSVAGAGGRTYLVRDGHDRLQFLRGIFSVVAEQMDVRWGDAAPPPSRTPRDLWFPRFHGTNMSYRRSALAAIGGFDERFEYLYDDGDIGVRMGLAGFRLRQLDDAVVYHLGATTGNRGRHQYDLNWYSWSRSQNYFAL
jgi:GT2 family glycosyltransferase